MRVIVNGEPRDLPAGTSVTEAVTAVTGFRAGAADGAGARPGPGVAAALNDEVVRRSAWDATTLNEADRLEVLIAVQGG